MNPEEVAFFTVIFLSLIIGILAGVSLGIFNQYQTEKDLQEELEMFKKLYDNQTEKKDEDY